MEHLGDHRHRQSAVYGVICGHARGYGDRVFLRPALRCSMVGNAINEKRGRLDCHISSAGNSAGTGSDASACGDYNFPGTGACGGR